MDNLLLEQRPITDEAIAQEAREDWHPDKLRYLERDFYGRSSG